MIQISLEVHQIRLGELQEQIRGFFVELPEAVARAPERVLLVDPFALRHVRLPARAHDFEALSLGFGCVGEELAVYHGVEEPFPVLAGDVGDEPGEALAVEADLVGEAGLDEVVG